MGWSIKMIKKHRCDGEVCNPRYYAKEGTDIAEASVNFCCVDATLRDNKLPEGWLYYPEERKLRCPRCVEYKEKHK
jgi:hypothetical protein